MRVLFGLNGRSGTRAAIENLELLADLLPHDVCRRAWSPRASAAGSDRGFDGRVVARQLHQLGFSRRHRSHFGLVVGNHAHAGDALPPACASICRSDLCHVGADIAQAVPPAEISADDTGFDGQRRRHAAGRLAFSAWSFASRSRIRRLAVTTSGWSGLEAHLQRLQIAFASLELLGGRAPCGVGVRQAAVGEATGEQYATASPASRSANLALEQVPAIAVAIDRLRHRLQLHLRALNRLQVRLRLRRQLTGVAALVVLEPLLLLEQPPLRVLELRVQELIRLLRLIDARRSCSRR